MLGFAGYSRKPATYAYPPLLVKHIVFAQVEKTLMEYISGGGERHKSITFSSKIFRPKYLTHVATLCTMYEVESSRLKNYCVRLAKELQ